MVKLGHSNMPNSFVFSKKKKKKKIITCIIIFKIDQIEIFQNHEHISKLGVFDHASFIFKKNKGGGGGVGAPPKKFFY